MRAAVYREDPDLPVATAAFSDIVARQRGRYRVWGRFYFAFAATALLLAALGVYGVLNFSVAARTAEFGIRRAVGASPRHLRLAVLRDALLQASIGMAAGLLLGAWIARGLGRIVYEVDTADARVFVTVAMVLALTGLLAGWLPASRAAAIDPAQAMRAR